MGLFTPSSDNESNTSKHRADRDGSKLVRSWSSFLQPTSLISTVILTGSFFLARHIHRRFLRQIPDVIDVEKSWYRRRSLLGYVTTIGDGDNFRMFHTPGGYFAGWGWLRKIPRLRKELAGRTLHIRLAGIDAPELGHFGNPAQPYGAEALAFLKNYLHNKRVRVWIHRRDQYNRIIGTVYTWPSLRHPFTYRDVSLRVLREGMATIYEAKWGVEFGGSARESKYRKAESMARRRKVGLWRQKTRAFESPREYKARITGAEGLHKAADDREKTTPKRSRVF